MRQASRARKLSVASAINAADAALSERAEAPPLRQPASPDPERSATTEIDSESAAYIEAYIEADEDVRNAPSLPLRLEAIRVAGTCGIVSDMARKGELPRELANAFIREFKLQAAKDLFGEDDLPEDCELGL